MEVKVAPVGTMIFKLVCDRHSVVLMGMPKLTRDPFNGGYAVEFALDNFCPTAEREDLEDCRADWKVWVRA